MCPAIHFLGLHIPMYALMLALGLASFFLLSHRALRDTWRDDRVTYHRILFVLCLSFVALGVFAFLFDGLFHSIEEGRLVFGGITWLGGVAGAFPALLLLTHFLVPKRRGYALDLLDLAMPGLALAHALGRLGCFFGGCCYGRVTDSPLGVVFPVGSPAASTYPNASGTGSLPVLPTQLFEAAFEVALFALLLLLARRTRRFHTAVWSMSYGIFRFILEFFRGDDRGSAGFPLSPAQVLSVLLFVFGLLVLLLRLGRMPARLEKRLASWQAAADALPVTPIAACQGDDAALLRHLFELRQIGAITEEEYEEKKQEILERM
ncbi:MAG: prolipoprotein diacylglyceryl transferase [Clostridia bacterium]|nr:prolipoprotein diacylglyceryl transferase [Clostridia bacterium]